MLVDSWRRLVVGVPTDVLAMTLNAITLSVLKSKNTNNEIAAIIAKELETRNVELRPSPSELAPEPSIPDPVGEGLSKAVAQLFKEARRV